MKTFVRLYNATLMTVFAALIMGLMYRLGQTGDPRAYGFILFSAIGFIAYLDQFVSTFPASSDGGEE